MDNASECGYGQKVIGLVGLKEIKIGLLLTVKAHFLNTLFGRCNECVMKEKSNQETQKRTRPPIQKGRTFESH